MISFHFLRVALHCKLILTFIFFITSFSLASQETFLVNTVADLEDVDLADSICADAEGNCSLRAAIENANLTSQTDNIVFDIPGEQVNTILLDRNLPPITETVFLDATTQPGYTWSTPKIIIDGSQLELIEVLEETPRNLVPSGFILTGNSSGSIIKGFVLGGFGLVTEDANGETDEYYLGIAIQILNTEKHLIQGNLIGVLEDGFTPFRNVFGITTHSMDSYPNSNENKIGGTGPGEANVIGYSWRSAVLLGYRSGLNEIVGNYLGIGLNGDQPIPNDQGISVSFPSYGNFIHDNLISGNSVGVHLVGQDNTVYNNIIGLNSERNIAVPNLYGVALNSSNNIIGLPNQGNLISGNETGVIVYTLENSVAHNNLIQHNFIGTGELGIESIPNKEGIIMNGIECKENNISNNIISGNLGNGISIESGANYNYFFGNLVGLNINKDALGNGKKGIRISGKNNIIGGYLPELANSIGFNVQSAIAIIDSIDVINNQISRNKIFNNGFGLDLGNDNLTTNDPHDRDSGPNNLQNSPDLLKANLNGISLELEYKIDSDPAYSTYPLTIEIFKSDGNRQGAEFLGGFEISANELPKGKKAVFASFELSAGLNLNNGDLIVSTATDASGNTSEFSPEQSVTVSGSCTPETWYADADSDGFGDPLLTQNSCLQPEGFVKNDTDCNDSDATIFPGASDDTVDGKDQNCDGIDGPVIGCQGTNTLAVSELCSDSTSVYWQISNPGSCTVIGRWELRKSSSTGATSGTFSLTGGETIQVVSGVVSKGKTQIVVYWNDTTGAEINTSVNSSGIACSGNQVNFSQSSSAGDFFVSPNPLSNGGLGIYFPAHSSDSRMMAKIYNTSGVTMASETFEVPAGANSLFWSLDHSTWIRGVYILNIKFNNKDLQTQIVK